ncbi:hypothetical protein pb186bvf_010768 [Paramecium bursaria]
MYYSSYEQRLIYLFLLDICLYFLSILQKQLQDFYQCSIFVLLKQLKLQYQIQTMFILNYFINMFWSQTAKPSQLG